MKIIKFYLLNFFGNLTGLALILYIWITHIEREIGGICNYWRPIETSGDAFVLSIIPTICVCLVVFNIIMLVSSFSFKTGE